MTEQKSEWLTRYLQTNGNSKTEGTLLEEILLMEEAGLEDLVDVVKNKETKGIFRKAALDRLFELMAEKDNDTNRYLEILRSTCDKKKEWDHDVRIKAFGWRFYLESDKQALKAEALRDANQTIHWFGTLGD